MHTRLLAVLVFLLTACTSEVERLYAPHSAFFRFVPVTAAQPLHAALGNPGVWCLAGYDATHYTFSSVSGATAVFPRTALDAYGRPRSIAGFIVGTPHLPNVAGQFEPMAYDRACPSCYESAYIERSLSLSSDRPDGAYCSRCRRLYDLATGGTVDAPVDGQSNVRLYRYRLGYNAAADVLVVQN